MYKRYQLETSMEDRSRREEIQCTRTITLFCIVFKSLPFVILEFCAEHNINTIRDIDLQPLLNNRIFEEHPSFLPILLTSEFVFMNP